jgi:hypothetical protein
LGFAVGVNLVLLIQLSEDISNRLSEPITGSVLGIAAVISTVIVSVTIFYMQKKVTRRINMILEQQHKMVEDKSERDKTKTVSEKE